MDDSLEALMQDLATRAGASASSVVATHSGPDIFTSSLHLEDCPRPFNSRRYPAECPFPESQSTLTRTRDGMTTWPDQEFH